MKRKKGYDKFNKLTLNEFGIQITQSAQGLSIRFSRESKRMRDMDNLKTSETILPILPNLPNVSSEKLEKHIDFSEKHGTWDKKTGIKRGITHRQNGKIRKIGKTIGDVELDLKRYLKDENFLESDFVEKAVELGLPEDTGTEYFNTLLGQEIFITKDGYYRWIGPMEKLLEIEC